MTDGIINLDTDRGRELGFTSDKYQGYLWKQGDAVVISFIMSLQKGNFRALVERILARGWAAHVPTPLGKMQQILIKNGYRHTVVPFSEDMPEPCDVWILDPTPRRGVEA